MREWLKANGGPPGVIVVGAGLSFEFWPLGVVLIVLGALMWLNAAERFPWKVVREANLRLSITDVVFTTGDSPPGRIQLTASVINKGAPTTLHSWELKLQLPEHSEQGIHLAGMQPVEDDSLKSLSDGTSLDPLGRGSMRGYVTFGLVGLDSEQLPRIKKAGVLVLSVNDQNDRLWEVSQSVPDLVAVGQRESDVQRPPPTPQGRDHSLVSSGARRPAVEVTTGTGPEFRQLVGPESEIVDQISPGAQASNMAWFLRVKELNGVGARNTHVEMPQMHPARLHGQNSPVVLLWGNEKTVLDLPANGVEYVRILDLIEVQTDEISHHLVLPSSDGAEWPDAVFVYFTVSVFDDEGVLGEGRFRLEREAEPEHQRFRIAIDSAEAE